MFADELKRTFRRPRNLVILGILVLIPAALGILVKTLGVGHRGGGPPFFAQLSQNPIFLSLAALTTMETFLLPLMVGLVAGDSIAGEANSGSLRYLVVAPAGRRRLILVKLASALTFALVAAVVIALSGAITGAILFPIGQIITLSGTTISNAHGVLLMLEAAAVVGVSMFSVVGVGVFVSTLTDSPAAASSIAVGVAIATEILGNIPQLAHIQPLLLSTYWGSFVDLLRDPQVLHSVGRNLLEQAGWLAVTTVAALVSFSQKDILS